jgi:hypothetical protein
MPLVTAAITRLVQQASQQRTVLVKNVGANPVDVSKDPAIVFGTADNFNLAANGRGAHRARAGRLALRPLRRRASVASRRDLSASS